MPKKAEVINIKPSEIEEGKKKRLQLDSGHQILIQFDGKEERLEIAVNVFAVKESGNFLIFIMT